MKPHIKQHVRHGDRTAVTTECVMCGLRIEMTVRHDGLVAWMDGQLIQRALPELSKDQRELLISGTCAACWDKMFKEQDDWE